MNLLQQLLGLLSQRQNPQPAQQSGLAHVLFPYGDIQRPVTDTTDQFINSGTVRGNQLSIPMMPSYILDYLLKQQRMQDVWGNTNVNNQLTG